MSTMQQPDVLVADEPAHGLDHRGTDLAAQAEVVAQLIGDECARLDAELHLGQRGTDVLGRARAFPVDHRAELQSAEIGQREAEALVRRLELERLVAARPVEREQRPDIVFVGARIAGIDLRADRYAGPPLPLLLRGGRGGEEQRGAGGDRAEAAKGRTGQNGTP